MIKIAPGWELDVDRSPEWLFVKVRSLHSSASDTPPLAEQVWALLQENSTYRVILEMGEVGLLYSYLIGQLVLLYKRIWTRGGVIRLCGLSPHNEEAIYLCRLQNHFPCFATRDQAVLGHSPSEQPG